jgi:hypothetical protein
MGYRLQIILLYVAAVGLVTAVVALAAHSTS